MAFKTPSQSKGAYGENANGEWYIFHDVNNQSCLFDEPDTLILRELKSYRPAEIPLHTNCRNTDSIVRAIQSELGVTIETRCIASGQEVRLLSATKKESPKALSELIDKLLDEGVPASSVTLLSPLPYRRSLAAHPMVSQHHSVTPLDEYAVRHFPHQTITFSEIRHFKGIENDVVIIIDMERPDKRSKSSEIAEYYVAMTRARELLCAIWR